MNIVIDMREHELIGYIKYFLEGIPKFKNITFKVESLPIGDIIIKDNSEEKIIIERKSLQDLAASIKDGRYEEQSYRLNGLPLHNHNIVYLIEGDVNKMNSFKYKVDKFSLYSAMFSLNYIKGFSVFRSFQTEESALMICQMAYKIQEYREKNREPFYLMKNDFLKNDLLNDKNILEPLDSLCESNKEKESTKEAQEAQEPQENYCNVVKRVKKENITPENIGEIILCQIPGISSVSAMAVMSVYKTIPQLIKQIQEDRNSLRQISYLNSKNQTRKLNKTAIENIIKYLEK